MLTEQGLGPALQSLADRSSVPVRVEAIPDGRVGEAAEAAAYVVDPALVTQLVDRPRERDRLADLTARERDVLALMAEGFTDRGISERLFITPKTTETHIRHIFEKLAIPATPADNRRVHAVLSYLRGAAA